MLKFLLILGIVTYVIYKVGSFFFRAGAASQHLRDFQKQQRNGSDAEKPKAKAKKDGKFTAGEYIDYEEVK